jgi:hypothetical protein
MNYSKEYDEYYYKESYKYIEYTNTFKYKYLSMYNLYLQGKETITPWEYINETKFNFIILYFEDVRSQYKDKLNNIRNKIIKRSNSF